ncbi:MAG TPA: acetate/propionate family kinase [Tahibacter sp.]|nr:acetate/propionate family kinase [Tahibacter sp.]
MTDALLVLNTGSSSLKFQALRHDTLDVLASGQVSGIGGDARFSARLGDARTEMALASSGHDAALAAVLDFIDRHDDGWRLRAIAHRVVHGGLAFVEPVVVTPDVLAQLERLVPLAPLHQPHNLAGIAASARLASHAPDVACFDTAFHARHDALFQRFAIPSDLHARGVRRYGFHGLSYEWIARVLGQTRPDLAAGRVVVAHLGNGASLCALHGGASVDTTMGMTALDGVPMGTRSGAIDPGAVTYLIRELGYDAAQVERVLYEDSGLKGLSGIGSDVRVLVASDAPEARFALDYFALKVAQYAAMMAVSIGGVDALVFTGGIGENATSVRDAIVARLGFLGDVETLVIPANEERMIALHAKALVGA